MGDFSYISSGGATIPMIYVAEPNLCWFLRETLLTDGDADVLVSGQVVDDWCRHVAGSEQQNLLVFLSQRQRCLVRRSSTSRHVQYHSLL